jgi:lipoprotein NlpD
MKVALGIALVVLLGGCGEAHVVQREPDVASPRYEPEPAHAGAGEVEVVRGDTLYGVAFRNGMDFRELAAINGIEAPYTIYVGQVLKLRGEHVRAPVPSRTVVQAPPHPPRTPPSPSTMPAARPMHVAPEPVTGASATMPPSQPVPTPFEPVPSTPTNSAQTASPPTAPTPQAAQPAPQPVPAPLPSMPRIAPAPVPTYPVPAPRVVPAPVAVQMPSAAIIPADVATVGGVHWRWPAKGSLLDHFMAGDATKQGIDIAGAAGEAVVAASDGVVVYSGSGLVGYGELIIIKHSDEWLSAYGHNRKRLVQEGQRVKGGQPIAEMGSTGAPRDELHFEIRRNGRPVDPLQYLPGR